MAVHPFTHMEGHIYCAIDTETTGTVPGFHDVIQVAFIPLDNWIKPSKEHIPFLMDLAPKRKENVDDEAMRINRMKFCEIVVNGVEPYRAADLFVEWFYRLNLDYNKRITPVGANYAFDRDFLIDWLGRETYNMCFNSDCRDVISIAKFRNDHDSYLGRHHTYENVSLRKLCIHFKVERHNAHDATDDARCTADVYRHLVEDFQVGA